jgi:hypothetical protein
LALFAFKTTAQQRGWKIGTLYQGGRVESTLGLACTAAITARTIFIFIEGVGDFSTALAFVAGLLGTGVLFATLGWRIGPLALVAAPIFCASIFFL